MERRFLLVAAAIPFVLAAAGCNAPANGRSEAVGEAPGRAEEAASPRDGTTMMPSIAERLVVKDVVWPEATPRGLAMRARFAEAELAKIDTSGVPVLAPSEGLEAAGHEGEDAAPFARAVVVAKRDWFTLSLGDAAFEAQRTAGRGPGEKGAGYTVFVQGNRLAKRIANVPPALGRATLRGRPAWITRNEHVWHATWDENGVSYVVEVECASFDDPHCEGDGFLRQVAESLVFVGSDAKGGAK